MLDILNNLLLVLNKIEVHGRENLALLYNAIDTIQQMRDGFKKNADDTERSADDTGHSSP